MRARPPTTWVSILYCQCANGKFFGLQNISKVRQLYLWTDLIVQFWTVIIKIAQRNFALGKSMFNIELFCRGLFAL